MQLIVSVYANCVIESLLLQKDYPKMQMYVVSWQRILFPPKWKYITSQWMSEESIVYPLIILNFNTYANVIFERSLRETGPCYNIGRNETNLDRKEWIFSVN